MMAASPRILIVEDDPGIREYLELGLGFEGFEVSSAGMASEALRLFETQPPDIVILDVMLPGSDGFHVLENMRLRSRVPILMLTAKDALEDRVRGLTLGADDYLVKPFAFPELVARLRAVLRRTRPDLEEILTYSDINVDLRSREARRAGALLELRPRTFDLLEFFLRYPERTLSKEVLLDGVWGKDFLGDENVVEVYVGYLRRALGEPPIVHTVRSAGYLLKVRSE
jgi:two-component system, OmpR family, response regulator